MRKNRLALLLVLMMLLAQLFSVANVALGEVGNTPLENNVVKLLSKRTTISSWNQQNMDLSTFDSIEGDTSYNKTKQKILEEAGVEFVLEAVENEQFETVISTRLASGQDLPDIINVGQFTRSQIVQYGRDGYFVNLLEAFEQYDEDGSIMNFLNTYYPLCVPSSSTEDGALYTIPWLYGNVYPEMGEGYKDPGSDVVTLVRGDWLAKCGIEYKTFMTTDEFKEMCIAFREQDANGNGIADEVIALDPTAVKWYNRLESPFGFDNWFTYNIDNAELTCIWYEKEALTGYVEWMRELIDADLFDMSIVGNSSVRSTLLQADRASVYGDYGKATWVEPQCSNPDCLYLPVIITSDIVQPTAINRVDRNIDYTNLVFAVPATGNVEGVVRMLDWWLDYDNAIWRYYGPDGDIYNYLDNGLFEATNKEISDEEAELRSVGFNLVEDALGFPRVQVTPKFVKDAVEYKDVPEVIAYETALWYGDLEQPVTEMDQNPPYAAATDAELEIMARYETDLTTYMEETLAKLVLGEYNLEDLDSYVEQMEKLGLKEYFQVQQDRLYRTIK